MANAQDAALATRFDELRTIIGERNVSLFREKFRETVAALPASSVAFKSKRNMIKRCFAEASGVNLLHAAAESGSVEIIDLLLSDDFLASAGVTGDTSGWLENADDDRRTPLHWAAWKCQIEAIKVLVARGARLDAKTLSGFTPLHYLAVRRSANSIAAAKILLDAGASSSVENGNASTPEQLARSMGHSEFADLLHEHEEQVDKRQAAQLAREEEIIKNQIRRDMLAAEASNISGVEAAQAKGTTRETAPSEKVAASSSDFVASKSFQGRKEGYVFKTDARGVGYYQDPESKGVSSSSYAFLDSSLLLPAAIVFLGASILAGAYMLSARPHRNASK